ncbi:related to transposase [Sporisorium reilianum f. sp. reilianum]|uniref:Related to transposase n=1 Tax=Sporisorium reilianum f. sp. reilianum TaxID=72559 RepID=A0A2N8UMP7_9BASI|nr:related to transposase [Sporisorium reilianum f. sp. reilianum]
MEHWQKNPLAGHTETAAACNDHEEKIQCALAELEDGQHASIGTVAAAHGIAKSTLHDRSKGKQSWQDTHTSQQALLLLNETALLNHIRRCATGGFPLNPVDVWDFTEYLACGGSSNSGVVKLGHNWVSSFLNRHLLIQSTWSRCLENARIRGTDKDNIRQWFGRLQEVITEYKILSNDIFNMDETGFVFGLSGSQHVIIPGGNPASRFKAQPGNCQNTTVIEAISSGDQVLLPLIIMKGKLHTVSEQRQMEDILSMWHFSKGLSSWTDNELAVL